MKALGYAKYLAAGIVVAYAFIKGVKAASNVLYRGIDTNSNFLNGSRNPNSSEILEGIIGEANRAHILETLMLGNLEHVCEHGDGNLPYIVENGVLIGLN